MNADLVTRLIAVCRDTSSVSKSGEPKIVLGDLGPHDMHWFSDRWAKELAGKTSTQRLDCGTFPYDHVDLYAAQGEKKPHISVFTPLAFVEVCHPRIYRALAEAHMIENGIPFVERDPVATLADRILAVVKEKMPEHQGMETPHVVADLTLQEGYALMEDQRFEDHGLSVGMNSHSPSLQDDFTLPVLDCAFDTQRPSVEVQSHRYFVETTRDVRKRLVRLAIIDAVSRGIQYVGDKKVVTAGPGDVVIPLGVLLVGR